MAPAFVLLTAGAREPPAAHIRLLLLWRTTLFPALLLVGC